VIASVDDAPAVVPSVATAAKTPVFGLIVTDFHGWAEGNARVVHRIPLVDEAAANENILTEKNRL
jgi:hypothetical protein